MTSSQEQQRLTKVALLGTGYIADFHYRALTTLPNVQVSAVCDLNRTLAQQFAASKRIPGVYTSLTEMLTQESLDVVHVLTPPNLHFATTREVLAAGVDALIEKPFCHTTALCQELQQQADLAGRKIGISHNFLYAPAYESLLADLNSGRLGQIDQVDIVWNRELGQLRGGPFGAWMLQAPQNILFEVAPHSFAHLAHLLGSPDSLAVQVWDPLKLPQGQDFYRRWEIYGLKDNTSFRLRFSFGSGYPEHYIHIRSSNGVARVDFQNDTYTLQEHTPYMLDLDRFSNVVIPARDAVGQAANTLANFVLSKVRLSKNAGPFPFSITRTVESFYATRHGELDPRVAPPLAEAAVAIAEAVAREAKLPATEPPAVTPQAQQTPGEIPPAAGTGPKVLILGGTGFIGQALVRCLCQRGYQVRVLARNPNNCPPTLKQLPIELVKGDFADAEATRAALAGIDYVYHLAKGMGKSWNDCLKTDVEPTRKVAELCLAAGVKRLFYTSSIAIYDASNAETIITEETPHSPGMVRVAPYARTKVANERLLMDLYKQKGLPVVIFRPGIVLGSGGNPYHWGVVAWPYHSVCQLYMDGNNPLPIVLVDDVATALVNAIEAPGIEGESFNLTAPACITANDYLDAFEQRAGLKLRRVSSHPLNVYLTNLVKWGIKVAGRNPEAAFPSFADYPGRSLASKFDASKAENKLNWHPIQDREKLIQAGIYQPVTEFLR
jgi:nucleoside-diphosphate-sugar epimerase/predicted dehydrogenase